MKEQLESLNSISINFGENGMMIVNILLAFIMFGVALGIKLETFKNVFRHPKSIITGILLQWVGLPAVTFLICMALNHWITRQHLQFHLLPLEGQCRAFRKHDSRDHRICPGDHSAQLLHLGNIVLQCHKHHR